MNMINTATIILAANGAQNLVDNIKALAISVLGLVAVLILIPHLLNLRISKIVIAIVGIAIVMYFANNLGAFDAIGKLAENMTKN